MDRSTRRGFIAGAASAATIPALASAQAGFATDWQSLAKTYRTPDWFRDAKFGIWAHWARNANPNMAIGTLAGCTSRDGRHG